MHVAKDCGVTETYLDYVCVSQRLSENASFLSICYYDKNVLKVPKSKSANISL